MSLKPYYQTENGVLYHGDCADIIPLLNPVDLVLTDPPYGIKRFESGSLSFVKKGEYRNGIEWDKKPQQETIELLLNISEFQIIWGFNNFNLPQTEYFLVWNKQQTVF